MIINKFDANRLKIYYRALNNMAVSILSDELS